MPESDSLTDVTDALAGGGRHWIDVLLVVSGLSLIAAGWPAVGAPLAGLGVVTPLLRWWSRRRGSDLYHLVPPALADSHRAVVAAANLAGVPDGPAVAAAADDALLEAAAVLAGRPPRGAAQHRFTAARVQAMRDAATEMCEWHEAWTAARAELEVIAPTTSPPGPAPSRPGAMVGLLAVVLLPAFLAWDGGRLAVRCVLALFDGLALRLRATGRLFGRAACGLVGLAGLARRVWNDARAVLADAAVESRHRSVALRLRVRLRLRQARRVRQPS